MAQPVSPSQLLASAADALAGVKLDQTGAYRPHEAVHVRDYPFPFGSALAVSNDCDSQSADCLFDWHNFVNGAGSTSYGDGLGLEVGDSHWIYGAGLEPALFKGHPFDANHVDGYALDTIVELSRLGWLDTLHSFGNWSMNRVPPDRVGDPTLFSRDQIRKGLDRLEELGLKPYVFVNHSGSPSNVGGPWGHYQKADDPTHALYCLDLLSDFGFKYFWIDPATQIDKFGENLAFGTIEEFDRALAGYHWLPWLRRRNAENQMIPIDLPDGGEERRDLLIAMFNRPYFPVDARDGSKVFMFKRYRDMDQPVGATFSAQVTEAKLDALEQMRGNVVVYQHFGVFGPRGRAPLISRPHRTRSPIPALDDHSVATWQLIADRNRQGRLFVATQGRLLDWLWRRDTLQLSVDRQDDRWVVTLGGFECSINGLQPVADDQLNGLAISVPSDAPDVTVVRPGRTGALSMVRSADPLRPGTDVLHLPWTKLDWPA